MSVKGQRPSWLLPSLTALLAALIFVFDTKTDVEVAASVFYVVVVLLSMKFCRGRHIILVASGCMILTILSYAISETSNGRIGLINCCISLCATIITAYLALKIDQTQALALEAQAQLAHLNRVAVLNELATSIAHEVNQPLAAIVTSGEAATRWIRRDPPLIDRADQAIQRIIRDASRASTVLARIRSLLSPARAPNELIDIGELIADTIDLCRREVDTTGALLHVHCENGLPKLDGDRTQLQQVVLNLIHNAKESIALAPGASHEIVVTAKRHGAHEMLVSVRDSGIGIGPLGPDRIFEPFITTKADGLGIGLTISRSIVNNHGGRIWATPNATRGAMVQFSLPMT